MFIRFFLRIWEFLGSMIKKLFNPRLKDAENECQKPLPDLSDTEPKKFTSTPNDNAHGQQSDMQQKFPELSSNPSHVLKDDSKQNSEVVVTGSGGKGPTEDHCHKDSKETTRFTKIPRSVTKPPTTNGNPIAKGETGTLTESQQREELFKKSNASKEGGKAKGKVVHCINVDFDNKNFKCEGCKQTFSRFDDAEKHQYNESEETGKDVEGSAKKQCQKDSKETKPPATKTNPIAKANTGTLTESQQKKELSKKSKTSKKKGKSKKKVIHFINVDFDNKNFKCEVCKQTFSRFDDAKKHRYNGSEETDKDVVDYSGRITDGKAKKKKKKYMPWQLIKKISAGALNLLF